VWHSVDRPKKHTGGRKSAAAAPAFQLNDTQRVALRAIRTHGALSRVQIADVCGVSAPAVTRIARELLERRLIREAGRGANARGQPSTNLSIDPEGAYAIGCFIEYDALSLVALDFLGEIVFRQRIAGRFSHPDIAHPVIRNQLNNAIRKRVPHPERLVGVGIAVTGNFVIDGRSVVPPVDMEHWRGIDLAELLQGGLEYPVIIENDASAAALGERLTGQGRSFDTFFYLYMGNGLGGGFILNGRLMRGARGNAAEIGRLLRAPKLRPTLRNLAEHMNRPLGDIAAEEIDRLFTQRERHFMSWLEQSIRNLNPALNAVAALLDPEAIVLGGRLPPAVIEYIVRHVALEDYGDYWRSVPRPVIVQSQASGPDTVVYGAAVLPFDRYL